MLAAGCVGLTLYLMLQFVETVTQKDVWARLVSNAHLVIYSIMLRVLDLLSRGRWFHSRLGHYQLVST